MEVANYQAQIDAINAKLDVIVGFIEERNRKQEEIDDLMADVGIVARDAFKNTVILLDKAGVELDSGILSGLVIKFLQNIGTFYEMMEMMESARDFMKDASPILHQVGLDAVHKMNELDQKGYFDYMRRMGSILDKWVQSYTPDDLQQLEENIGTIAGILRQLTDPKLVNSLDRTLRLVSEIRIDDELDNKSLWQLFGELRSPEIRKSFSYSLRIVKALHENKSARNL